MQTQYRIKKGRGQIAEIVSIPGIHQVFTNPFAAGPDVVEVIHNRDPKQIPVVVKDQTFGRVILEEI